MEGYMAGLWENIITSQVEGLYLEGGWVAVGREHGSDRVKGVGELKKEMGSIVSWRSSTLKGVVQRGRL
jgi:hypothetical protein